MDSYRNQQRRTDYDVLPHLLSRWCGYLRTLRSPLNQSLEDGSHEPFIANKVSTPENRKRVENFQLEVLKRKSRLLPMFEKYCSDKGYTFRIPIAEVYDFNVLEYSFALWQWGTPVNKIPETNADDHTLFKHFMAICEPDYFSEQSPTLPLMCKLPKNWGITDMTSNLSKSIWR